MADPSLSKLEDLNQRAQLALQRQNRTTAQKLWRDLLSQRPAPQSDQPLTDPSVSSQHALAAQACFALQQSIDEAAHETEEEEREDEEEEEDQETPDLRPEQIELLRRALCHAKVLVQPTTAQQDLEAGLMRATLASLLLPAPPAGTALQSDHETPRQLFDLALECIKSASTKRKNELLTALRPTSGHAPATSKNSQDLAGALQVIYDAPSSHFIHLAQDLPLEDLDALAKSSHQFFNEQVPGSMGALGKAETALNVGEVLVDRLEEEEEEEDVLEGDDKESQGQVEQIKVMARGWLQQGVSRL